MLSIVIPAYNVADTLDRCMESVVGQSLADIEVILVDDGSTDSTPDKCDAWERRDSRVKVVHKSNGGLSSARNAGIELAAGDYITFVDSDDYVEKDTYRQLTDITGRHPEYDILEFPVCRFFETARTETLTFGNNVYTDMAEYWLAERVYSHTYAWNKLYRRELFREVRFPVGKVFEDAHTLPLLLKAAKVAATTDAGLYCYTHNPRGITATARGIELEMLLDAHIDMLAHLPPDSRTQPYYLYVLNLQLMVCRLTGKAPRLQGRKIARPLAVKLFKMKVKSLLLNLLGMRTLCRLSKMLPAS